MWNRATRALKTLGMIKAEGSFSGGNDEGFMDYITLYDEDGNAHVNYQERNSHDYGRVTIADMPHTVLYEVLLHPKQKAANTIFEYLWQPVAEKYGGFGGEGHVSGRVFMDENGRVVMGQPDYLDWDD